VSGGSDSVENAAVADEIEDALEALVIGNDQFAEIESALDVFCPFEAIGMVGQEIRHAHFLEYVIDPQRPHGLGSEALRVLMDAVTRAVREQGGTLSPLDVHLMGLDSAEVRREWRSIDLLVVVSEAKLVMAIELKIGAGENGDQLSRYRNVIDSEWPQVEGWRRLFVFLTKSGAEASEDHGIGWVPVRLEEVVERFALLADKQIGHPDARMMLSAYAGMMRRHHLTNGRLEKLAQQLWSQHREALDFLAERRPDLLGNAFATIFAERDEIATALSKQFALTIVSDHSTTSFVRFAVGDWDEAEGLMSGFGWTSSKRIVPIELEKRSSSRTITARFELGQGDTKARERVFNALAARGADLGGNWGPNDNWRQLANKVLVRLKEDDARTADDVVTLVRDGFVKFLEHHLPAYDKAIRSLNAQPPA
jgi:hypothetical protein